MIIPGTIQPIIAYVAPFQETASRFVEPVERAVLAITNWYILQLGRSLRMTSLDVLRIQDAALYKENVGEAVAQTLEANGYPTRLPDGTTPCPYSYLVFAVGTGGYAGTTRTGAQAGLAIIGDACLEALAGNAEKALAYIQPRGTFGLEHFTFDAQCGAVAHELYHAFGLPEHEFASPNLSGTWWEFPNTSLLLAHKAHILTLPYNVFLLPPTEEPSIETSREEPMPPTPLTSPTIEKPKYNPWMSRKLIIGILTAIGAAASQSADLLKTEDTLAVIAGPLLFIVMEGLKDIAAAWRKK